MAATLLPQKRREHPPPLPMGGIRFTTREEPDRLKWVAKGIFALILFIAGAGVNLFAGAMIGLSMGIGPDETGGTIYLLFGSAALLILGVPLRVAVSRASRKRTNGILAWYAFTGTAYLFAVVWGWVMVLWACEAVYFSMVPSHGKRPAAEQADTAQPAAGAEPATPADSTRHTIPDSGRR